MYPLISMRFQAIFHCLEYIISKKWIINDEINSFDEVLIILLPVYVQLYSNCCALTLGTSSSIILCYSWLINDDVYGYSKYDYQDQKLINIARIVVCQTWILFMPKRNNINDDHVRASSQGDINSDSVLKEGLVHDIRNLLNQMLTLVSQNDFQFLVDDNISSLKSQIEYCRTLLENLIKVFLNRNSPETSENLDLRIMLEKIFFMLKPHFSAASLNSFFILENKTPVHVLVEKQYLIPIIVNLLTNSLKFTDKGFVNMKVLWEDAFSDSNRKSLWDYSENISIEDHDAHANDVRIFDSNLSNSFTENVSQNQNTRPNYGFLGTSGRLVILISDSGVGIPSEKMQDIFKKHQQFHNDEDKRKLGTGVGLWYCKWLVDKLNGNIELVSRESLGTTIRLDIPCYRVRESGSYSKSIIFRLRNIPKSSNGIANQQGLTSSQILFVDDDKFILSSWKKFFNEKGLQIITAASGEEAIEIFHQTSSITVIFLDIQLREMDGFQTAKNIKGIKGRKCRIFGLTGYSEESISNQATNAGIEKIFSKPVNQESLFSLLKESALI